MMTGNVLIPLAAALFFSHNMADGKDVTTLRVCEGSVANFTNDYETTGHDRLIYSFRNKSGHFTQAYEIETPGKGPTIPADFIHRFRRTSLTEVGFTLNNVSISDEGNYMCFIIYSDGSQQRFTWTLRVEDSTKLNKPKIDSCEDKSRCVTYKCSHNETVEVDVYWKFAADKRVNGSHLFMCEKNRSKIITCILKSFCDVTHEYTITKEPKPETKALEHFTGHIQSAATEEEEGTQTPSFGSGIGIGIVIGILIGFAGTITVYSILKRRKRNPEKDAADQQQSISNQEEGKD